MRLSRLGGLLVLVAGVASAAACKDEPAPPTKASPPSPTRSVQDAASRPPSDAIAALADEGVRRKWIVGAAVAVVQTGAPPRFVFVGTDGRGATPSSDTRFAIGSVTKVMTSLLLADASLRGEVRLDQAVAEVSKLPMSRDSHAITFRHLAQHSSGLPRMPRNMRPTGIEQPYAGYGRKELESFLAGYKLRSTPGKLHKYSNLGAALLGSVLADRAGTDYEALVRERITKPLGLAATTVGLDDEARKRAAGGHNGLLRSVPHWDLGVFAPAGSVWSTAPEMARFIHAQLEPTGPLAAAIQLTHEIDVVDKRKMGLGWHVTDADVFWHNGQTGGFHSYVAFDKKRGVGVVVLANTATATVDPFGAAVLELAAGNDTGFHWPEP